MALKFTIVVTHKTFWRFIYLKEHRDKPVRTLYFMGWKRMYKLEWGE